MDSPAVRFGASADYAPKTLDAAIQHLRRSQPLHVELGRAAIDAGEGNVYPADTVVLGVIQRSLDLISGFSRTNVSGLR